MIVKITPSTPPITIGTKNTIEVGVGLASVQLNVANDVHIVGKENEQIDSPIACEGLDRFKFGVESSRINECQGQREIWYRGTYVVNSFVAVTVKDRSTSAKTSETSFASVCEFAICLAEQ